MIIYSTINTCYILRIRPLAHAIFYESWRFAIGEMWPSRSLQIITRSRVFYLCFILGGHSKTRGIVTFWSEREARSPCNTVSGGRACLRHRPTCISCMTHISYISNFIWHALTRAQTLLHLSASIRYSIMHSVQNTKLLFFKTHVSAIAEFVG